jgi:hypothetical protein
MGWHSDPQGDVWAPETAVVSVGAPRRFGFRSATLPGDAALRTDFTVRSGDVVWMDGACQTKLQHALFAADEAAGEDVSERMSLVFKRRLDEETASLMSVVEAAPRSSTPHAATNGAAVVGAESGLGSGIHTAFA